MQFVPNLHVTSLLTRSHVDPCGHIRSRVLFAANRTYAAFCLRSLPLDQMRLQDQTEPFSELNVCASRLPLLLPPQSLRADVFLTKSQPTDRLNTSVSPPTLNLLLETSLDHRCDRPALYCRLIIENSTNATMMTEASVRPAAGVAAAAAAAAAAASADGRQTDLSTYDDSDMEQGKRPPLRNDMTLA
jgi:hypothetical protein